MSDHDDAPEIITLEYDEQAERGLRREVNGPSIFGRDMSMFHVARDSEGRVIEGCFHSGTEHDEN